MAPFLWEFRVYIILGGVVRHMSGLMETAREMTRESLPIKCLEAVILGMNILEAAGEVQEVEIHRINEAERGEIFAFGFPYSKEYMTQEPLNSTADVRKSEKEPELNQEKTQT